MAFIVKKIWKEGIKMDNNAYTPGKKFECCGNTMATVIIKGRTVCVMTELEYNRIVETERKYRQRSKRKVA